MNAKLKNLTFRVTLLGSAGGLSVTLSLLTAHGWF